MADPHGGTAPKENGENWRSQDNALLRLSRPLVTDEVAPPVVSGEFEGVTLEFLSFFQGDILLLITNQSGYDISYNNACTFSFGQWSYKPDQGYDSQVLPVGQQRKIVSKVPVQFDLWPGTWQVAMEITVDSTDSTAWKPFVITTDFTIEAAGIALEAGSVELSADSELAAPVGAQFDITNNFKTGHVYFDASYWLQHNVNGSWQDLPIKSSDNFRHETRRMAPGETTPFVAYWAWLYGELPPGEYRIGKTVMHRDLNGADTRHELWAVFNINADPISETITKNGGTMSHPFAYQRTFRAKVVSRLNPYRNDYSRETGGLRVDCLTPMWNDGELGEVIVWDSLYTILLNQNNEQIGMPDIPDGVVVDITYGGWALESDPPQISAYLIAVVES
ncbi:MAG: hypothetical protein FWG47_02570 [Propionibacteriaceae bacterium]|nr:hypothetical protein [Propionibacteriaceae bacterium]